MRRTLVLLIVYVTLGVILTQVRCSPKTEVENVPGIILPIFIGRVCMLRRHYDCRWTYEKSCNCNPLARKDMRRVLDITFVRMKAGKKLDLEVDDECEAGEDKCIKF